jgi:hypothetical protein
MPNVIVQISNRSNIKTNLQIYVLSFDIWICFLTHLAFAGLPKLAQAGILTFDLYDFLLSNRRVTGPSLTR